MDERDLDLTPHPERVDEQYAEQRIATKLAMYESTRPQQGLRNVDEALKRAGVPPAYRLHYITAVAHLGRKGAESLDRRVDNALGGLTAREAPGLGTGSFEGTIPRNNTAREP